MNALQYLRRYLDPAVAPPVGQLIGHRLVVLDEGKAIFELDADPARHANPMGTIHGGILCDLADAAMGMAWGTTLGEGESYTTVELKINFLKPVRKTRLRAEGRIVKRGQSVGMTECDVFDESGTLVARASSTIVALRGESANGR